MVSACPADMPSACSITRTRETLVIRTDHTSGGTSTGSIQAVAIENHRQRFSLLLAETLRVIGNLGLQRLAVIGQRDEFHGDRGGRRIDAEPPQRPQWLPRLQYLRLRLKPFFSATTKCGQEQLVHRAEVVVDELRLERRLLRYSTRSDCGITFFEHQLLGGVEQHAAILGVRCSDPARRSHAVVPNSRRILAEHADRSVGDALALTTTLAPMLSRCSARITLSPNSVRGGIRLMADRPPHTITGKSASGGA